ncbi:hypothetical protein [Actinomadura chokoriensis]|uniref:Uncharacterized protein n=1 Tax=Actinomadura chokoriensis TaxID=454156 RepID=A0ABV4R6N6_9ACTN
MSGIMRFKIFMSMMLTPALIVSSQSTAIAAETELPTSVSLSSEPGRTTLTIGHGVDLKDAMTAVSQSEVNVLEYHFDGNGVVGGMKPDPNRTLEFNLGWAKNTIKQRYNRTPIVSNIVVSPTTSAPKVRALREKLTHAPRPVLTNSPVKLSDPIPATASKNLASIRREPQDIPEHFPSLWRGYAYPNVYAGANLRSYDNIFIFQSAVGANPTIFPSDWGMELGITTFNDSIIDRIRPFCGGDGERAHTEFWSSTYYASPGYLWTTNIPPEAAPYADSNIQLDSCQANSAELGVGYPANLHADTWYNLLVELAPGNSGNSPASASVSMLSNDCTGTPDSDCMGLNTDRQPPTGFEKVQSYVNRDRNWVIPSCAYMEEGLDSPVFAFPGGPFWKLENCPEQKG